jgi:hypothetical protein
MLFTSLGAANSIRSTETARVQRWSAAQPRRGRLGKGAAARDAGDWIFERSLARCRRTIANVFNVPVMSGSAKAICFGRLERVVEAWW